VEQIPLYSAVSRAVGGTLSGLPAGAAITLQNSGTDTVTLTANGAFSFSTKVAGGKPYSVSVLTQPNGQICGVAGGQGTIGFGDVASIAVNCSTNIFTIAGTTSGWIPGSLVVDGGFGQAITVSGTGTFAFPTPVLAGTSYGISVTTPQDPDLSCTLSGQSGVVAANVTNIGINCSLYGQHSGLSSDGTYLYWARDLNPQNGNFVQGSLTRVPLLGGASPSVLASNLVGVNVSSTAVDATYLYFTAWDAGTVNRIPVAGGTVTPIATGMAHPNSLLLNGTTLYWATDDHIYSLDLAVSAGIPRQVAANSSTSNPTYHAPPRRIATSSGLLYWIDGGVWRSSLLGSDAVLLASGSALGGGLAVADGQVFFAATVPGLMSVQQ
jgi:hypothetical protein